MTLVTCYGLVLLALAALALAKHHDNFLSPAELQDEYWRAYGMPDTNSDTWDLYPEKEEESYPYWQQVLMQQLGLEPEEYPNEEEYQVMPENVSPKATSDEPKSKAKTRAQEYVQQPGIGGPIVHTGGSDKGEGVEKQQTPAVKTDALLPAYCSPPNPCPVGYTAANGCDDTEFENTAAWVQRYQASQECECDRDHMLNCPTPSQQARAQGQQQEETSELEAIQDLLGMERPDLIAKKRPFVRRRRAAKVNPYLQGPKLRRAAKKSPGHAHVFAVPAR